MKIEELLETLEENYKILANEKFPMTSRHSASRVIAQNIVEYYIATPEINKEFYASVRENWKKNQKIKREKTGEELLFEYKNSQSGKLNYLIHNKEIPYNLENGFRFIWSEASNFASHQLKGKGNEKMIEPSLIFVTEILKWFYQKHKKDATFILNLNPEEETIDQDIENSDEPDSKIKMLLKKRISRVFVFIAVCILVYWGVQSYQKSEKRKNIIEFSNIENRNRKKELTNLQESITLELLNGQKKDLSNGLITGIIALSESFKPYRYLKNNALIEQELSPERAILFKSLIKYNLGESTYEKIFSHADFSYADFSDMDLSYINMRELLMGVHGTHTEDAQLFLTTMKRPNLKRSNFDNTNLYQSTLYGNFSESKFNTATIRETSFLFSKVTDADFSKNKKEISIRVYGSDMTNSNFEDLKLNLSFSYSDLRGVSFNNSEFFKFKKNVKKELVTRSNFLFENDDNIFESVLLSGDDLMFSFESKGMEVMDNHVPGRIVLQNLPNKKNDLHGVFKFIKSHYCENQKMSNQKAPLEFVQKKNGPPKVFIHDDFEILNPEKGINRFIELWKENPSNIYHYITRTNDHYFPDSIWVEDQYQHINSNYEKVVKRDSVVYKSGKKFHFPASLLNKEKRSSITKCKLISRKSLMKSASFENCKFNDVTFYTKINNVSFRGSAFKNAEFSFSELYNIDLRGIHGELTMDDCKVDSLFVDSTFKLNFIDKKIDSLLKIKEEWVESDNKWENKKGTFKEYIEYLKKESRYNSISDFGRLGMFKKLELMKENFIFVRDSANPNRHIIRHKQYLKILQELKMLSIITKSNLEIE